MMDGGDLVLVGSSPPTYRGSTPVPTNNQQTSANDGDSGRIEGYFTQNGRGTAQQQETVSNVHRRTVTSGYKKPGSYPGGNMTSSRSSEVDWNRPAWGSNNKNKAFDNATRYNINRHNQSRPISQMSINQDEDKRPQSRTSQSKLNKSRPTSAKKNNFKPSYVDELLFGSKLVDPDFSAPWSGTKVAKGHMFDYTNYKEQEAHTEQSSRPSSRTCVPRHRSSYVDESLFGPKQVDPGWEAPWSKPEPKRIHMFDEFQHKVTIQHNDVEILRPKSSVYMRKPRPASSSKPIWR